ncbi:putative ribonuclease H-like domain-containing protein [Tanacetum coccineum]|uniref:Ribonuclease H-like domain-containing protein n=1 Tax=Tanacetum coccineum TaxID=301880 RepID=A0ABQ5FN96_9ASTR
MPNLEEIVYSDDDDEEVGVEADMNNLATYVLEVYVCHQPPGFEDPQFPDKVYKVEKAIYGLHQAPRAWYKTLPTYLLENRFRGGTIDKTLFIKKERGDILLVQQKDDGIFISQDKYEADILKKFDFATVKTASTPIETNKALLKDEEAEDLDVHLYRSMIGLLMYLTAYRPDIMFVVCACARFQVTPKVSHLHAMNRIFRYLKGQPKLGLWYPKDSPFDLEAFSDSDYVGASLDRKSTTGGCQFLGKRLISWQCKKQTIVANSTTEAEYVVAANCCGQVLWVQNQMLDYGFNFMNTKIYIDNESTICIVKNLVFHSKTKHIEIRHHFIRDSYEKKLIQVIKIHTDHNVADLLTKAFDWDLFPVINLRLVIKEWEDRMERVATTASSLVAEQDSGIIATAGLVNTVRLNLMLPVQVNVVEGDFINTSIKGLSIHSVTSAKAKTVNGERQIQALVDKKKVIITETSIGGDLKLNDVDGTDCLPTATIFAELERMGAKTTAWNEFSSTMASIIICLATNKKINFSKYIFVHMMKNLEAPEDTGEDSAAPTDSYSTPIITQPSSSKPQKKKSKKETENGQCGPIEAYPDEPTNVETISTPSVDHPQSGEVVLEEQEIEFEKVVKEPVVSVATTTKSIPVSAADPVTTAGEVVTTASASVEIPDELTLAQTLIEIKTAKPKPVTTAVTTVTSVKPRAKGIIFHDQEEQVPASTKTFSSSQSQLPQVKDKGKGKMVEPERPLKKKDQVALDEEMARNLEAQMQAELIEEKRLARQKEKEANIALIES